MAIFSVFFFSLDRSDLQEIQFCRSIMNSIMDILLFFFVDPLCMFFVGTDYADAFNFFCAFAEGHKPVVATDVYCLGISSF